MREEPDDLDASGGTNAIKGTEIHRGLPTPAFSKPPALRTSTHPSGSTPALALIALDLLDRDPDQLRTEVGLRDQVLPRHPFHSPSGATPSFREVRDGEELDLCRGRWFRLRWSFCSWRFLLLPGSYGLDDFAGLPANMIRLLDAVFDLTQVIECRHELMPKFANAVDCDWGMIFHGETMPHSGSGSAS